MSALCKTRLFATQALMFVAMPSFILSGFTWPVSAMPEPIAWLSKCLPLSYFVHSFRFIYLADVDFTYISSDFFSLVGFLMLNILLAVVIIRQLVKRAESHA